MMKPCWKLTTDNLLQNSFRKHKLSTLSAITTLSSASVSVVESRRHGRFNKRNDIIDLTVINVHDLENRSSVHLAAIYEPYLAFVTEYEKKTFDGKSRYEEIMSAIENDVTVMPLILHNQQKTAWFLFPLLQGSKFKTREITLPLLDDDDNGVLSMRRYLTVPEVRGISLRRNLIRTYTVIGDALYRSTKHDRYNSSSIKALGYPMACRATVCAKRFALATEGGWDLDVFNAVQRFDELLESEIMTELDCADQFGHKK